MILFESFLICQRPWIAEFAEKEKSVSPSYPVDIWYVVPIAPPLWKDVQFVMGLSQAQSKQCLVPLRKYRYIKDHYFKLFWIFRMEIYNKILDQMSLEFMNGLVYCTTLVFLRTVKHLCTEIKIVYLFKRWSLKLRLKWFTKRCFSLGFIRNIFYHWSYWIRLIKVLEHLWFCFDIYNYVWNQYQKSKSYWI